MTQQNVDEKLPQMHKNVSDSNAHTKNSDAHSSQAYMKSPNFDTCVPTEVPDGTDATSNPRHDSNIRHDTDSTSSKEMNVTTDQFEETIQNENFCELVKRTYNLTPTQSSQTHTDTRHVPNIQLTQRHTGIFFFSFFPILCFPSSFFSLLYRFQKINQQHEASKQTTVIITTGNQKNFSLSGYRHHSDFE